MKRIQNNVLVAIALLLGTFQVEAQEHSLTCLLYTSDAADEQ